MSCKENASKLRVSRKETMQVSCESGVRRQCKLFDRIVHHIILRQLLRQDIVIGEVFNGQESKFNLLPPFILLITNYFSYATIQ